MSDKTTYKGSCHCGNVRYTVAAELKSAMSCNCSICSRTGALLAFVPAADFKLESGEGSLSDYQFNKHVVHHLFCQTCGVRSFSRGKKPDGTEMVALNIRCLDGIDLDAIPVQKFDGKSR